MKKKIIFLFMFSTILIVANQKKVFQSNSKQTTVKTKNSSEKIINVEELKKKYFNERFVPYRTLSPNLMKIFQKFDTAFIGFFEAQTEEEQIQYSKQLMQLQQEYSNILPKGIKNEYSLCIAVLDTFMPKK
jgi:hypothetical protein